MAAHGVLQSDTWGTQQGGVGAGVVPRQPRRRAHNDTAPHTRRAAPNSLLAQMQ
jgi:hypothetical protein